MKSLSVLGIASALLLAAASASADNKAECLNAAGDGQTLRDAHKLIEARDKFRVCAAASCPPAVQSDCAGWLASVEKALPSVVVTAKDGTGTALIEVKVTVDGQPFATTLGGEAVLLNPGPHKFHFEAPAGTLDQVVVAAEGDQNVRVAVVLGRATTPEAKESPPPGTQSGSASPPGPSGNIDADTAGGSKDSSWKTIGWVVGGVGLVGLGVGTVFGTMAISDHNSANCNSNHVCLTGPLNDARGAATIADVGLIAGGVLLATGLGLVLFAPGGSDKERPTTTAFVVPVVGHDGGGLGVGGTW